MSKAPALRRVKTAQTRLSKTEAAATAAAEVRDASVAVAREAGATYGELRDATGLSPTRVTQILRRLRESAG